MHSYSFNGINYHTIVEIIPLEKAPKLLLVSRVLKFSYSNAQPQKKTIYCKLNPSVNLLSD